MKKIKVFGVPASPYTQKMISILRYRHIAYEVFIGDVPGRLSRLEGIEPPKPILLPTLLLEDESGKLKATTDTTPIIRRFENEYPNRKLLPEDPALSFINYLLEDFGDEWVTKYMFHYRLYFDEDADHASTVLPLTDLAVNMHDERLQEAKKYVHGILDGRVWIVCWKATTAEIIDANYQRAEKLKDDK